MVTVEDIAEEKVVTVGDVEAMVIITKTMTCTQITVRGGGTNIRQETILVKTVKIKSVR